MTTNSTKENSPTTTTPSSIHNHSSCSSIAANNNRLSWSPTTVIYDERRNNSLPVKLNDPNYPHHRHHQHQLLQGGCTSSAIPSLSPTVNEDARSCDTTTHPHEKYHHHLDKEISTSSEHQDLDHHQQRQHLNFQYRIRNVYTKYSQSLLLENTASVARDHLANERTFLAWLRTSLSLITVGVGITQLYHLSPGDTTGMDHRKLGRSIGAIFVTFSILFLYFGNARYFHAQHAMCKGFFPASRGTVLFATTAVLGILLSMFVVLLLEHTG